MSYVPTRLVERAWVKPPRCLLPFNVTPLRTPPAKLEVFDELGFFGITCLCGGQSFSVLGYPQEEGFFAAPLKLSCASCSSIRTIFDIAEHGYDSELGHGCYSTRGSGTPSAYRCPSCDSEIVETIAGVSYQIEPIEDMKPEDQERSQDLFDWFYLEAVCTNCREISGISDYECA
jgi:hypothetical protein